MHSTPCVLQLWQEGLFASHLNYARGLSVRPRNRCVDCVHTFFRRQLLHAFSALRRGSPLGPSFLAGRISLPAPQSRAVRQLVDAEFPSYIVVWSHLATHSLPETKNPTGRAPTGLLNMVFWNFIRQSPARYWLPTRKVCRVCEANHILHFFFIRGFSSTQKTKRILFQISTLMDWSCGPNL